MTHATSLGLDNRKLAFWAFIGSECLLFGALIVAFLLFEPRGLADHLGHHLLG